MAFAMNKNLLRTSAFPSIWCPGCGHGIITQALARACGELGWEKDDIFSVSGIGCSARVPAYLDFNSVQTTHGRAIAFATGMKLVKPEKHVFLTLGDGDCMSIGGNHFLHACKRNIDLTIIVYNNNIYGMTGGQVSPTTPYNAKTTTSPFGNIDEPIDICKVAEAAGATFVARSTVYHANQLPALIKRGLEHHGLSVIEVKEPCPTNFGRRNGFKNVKEMYMSLRDNAVPLEKAQLMTEAELEGKFVTGVFVDKTREEYVDKYYRLVEKVKTRTPLMNLTAGNYQAEKLGKPRYECQLCGSGGQGLIMSGILLAEAMIRQGKHAVHTQSYGVEARGGASRSEVVISDEEISFPEITAPDIMMALTQVSYDKFAAKVAKGGIILVDSTFVKAAAMDGVHCYAYPITRVAKEEIGLGKTANILALGLLTGLLPFIAKQAMKDAILARLPKKVHAINLKAFEKGYEEGCNMKIMS